MKNEEKNITALHFRKRITSVFRWLVALCIQQVSFGQPVKFTIDLANTAQTIDNFGASGAWYSEGIGKHWPDATKERMAELLFSKAFDASGNPLGIGLSCWRFNVGGGTAEQGDSSGISNAVKRVECFLSPNGSYDWTKQEGYRWFVRKAAHYGVENLVAFSNTPPVQFTKNGLGFQLQKNYETNLREDKYSAYAGFLATVVQHFEKEGLHFKYVSPVNEPQWDWSNRFGQMNQEGSPWHDKDIYRIALALDSALTAKKLSTQILLPEAGILTALYEGRDHASRQIQTFYGRSSPHYLGHLQRLFPVIAGHGYFTDKGDTTIVSVRSRLRDTAAKYSVRFWQSEYCMLADGYKEGKRGRMPAMDCALFLAKLIYHDLAIANASAWQFWNAWEPGSADVDTRYYLLALQTNAANTEGDFVVTKNLWALGHFSRFIRPGMKRIIADRNDGLTELQAAQDLMLSAFADKKQVVVVGVNYSSSTKDIQLQMPGVRKIKRVKQYVTTVSAEDNMRRYPVTSVKKIQLKPRSITTVIVER